MNKPSAALSAGIVAALLGYALSASAGNPMLDVKKVEAAIPGVKVRSIEPVTITGGLFEVIDDQGNVFYVDGAARIAFQTEILEIGTRRNLTAESAARFKTVDFKALPLQLAIKRVKGDGRRRMAVFADPDCPYCVKLEQELQGVDNVTVYTYLYPIEQLHPGADGRANRIWCASDPDAAWRAWLLEKRDAPAPGAGCAAPVARIAEVAKNFWVNGTPSLVFGSGRVVSGMIAKSAIEGFLEEAPLRAVTAQQDAGTPAR